MTENKGLLPQGAVLLDASTVDLLASHVIYHSLTGNHFADTRIASILHGVLLKQADSQHLDASETEDAYGLNHALCFLELWVLVDTIFVDIIALESLETNWNRDNIRNLSRLFQKTEIPKEIRSEAANRVTAFYDYFSTSDNPLTFTDFDLCLKDNFYGRFNGRLGVSSNTWSRAVFYLEVSHILGVPLFLHPCKSRFLADIGQAFEKSSAVVYYMFVDQVRREMSYEEHDFFIPPIADEIVRVARSERMSLVEAAKEIRDRPEIVDFREFISQLWKIGLERGNVAQGVNLKGDARKIARKIESKWGLDGRISRRKINFAELPPIGPFLKAINYHPEFYVPDFVLYERPFIALFSRWANEVRRQ